MPLGKHTMHCHVNNLYAFVGYIPRLNLMDKAFHPQMNANKR